MNTDILLTVPGYQIQTQLYASPITQVYRAWNTQLDKQVILKVLLTEQTSPEMLRYFRQEYEITRRLQLTGVIGVYALELTRDAQILVLEDIEGDTLKQLSEQNPLSIEQVLSLAIQIAETLGEVHAAHVIHKDINPANIVYNSKTGVLKIIDFGIATFLPRENPTLKSPTCLEGTLAYIAPEQTGRMNRIMDYRTDYYGFGITLFQLLTGQLPFEAEDDLAMVHAHIAKIPPSPHEINADIPPVLSNIVVKLMAKMAEDRYQSSIGVKQDLQACLQHYQEGRRLDPDFTLGDADLWDQFLLPQHLYGREHQVKLLLSIFDRVCQGQSELLMVAGFSGIGKTSLVSSCHKPITAARGYFITGKFDQFQRNIPYSAVVNAFRDLIQQLLTESDDCLTVWKAKLHASLGVNAQVIIDVIPEVEMIMGSQPAIELLGATEAQNRFHFVMQNFIGVFCQPDHPLTVFLDDLQWADSASLNLLSLMMAQSGSLFLIGAYRDNEVNPAHPLMVTLADLAKIGKSATTITLEPLTLAQATQFIADTVHGDLDRVEPLAQLVYSKTQGNPFFLSVFLKSLYSEKLITFDYQQESWVWDETNIHEKDMTDNVVDMMAGKLRTLEPHAQEALKLGACIGNQFDLNTLAIILEQSPHNTAGYLLAAMKEDLVLALGDGYKLVALEIESTIDTSKILYKFAHDRIQQAAYSLIPEAEKRTIHYRIGTLLLKHTPQDQLDRHIFMLVDQLNEAVDLVQDDDERLALAKLNLQAGSKAKNGAAYAPACNYLIIGLRCLPTSAWQARDEIYRVWLESLNELAAAQFLLGNHEDMTNSIEEILDHAQALLDKVGAYEIKLQALMSQQKQIETINVALEVLALLGVTFPKNPNDLSILRGLLTMKFLFAGRKIDTLLTHKDMCSPRHLAAMRIMANVWAAAYQAVPQLMPLLVFKMVYFSVRYGNAHESVLAYAWYGVLLCGVTGDIKTGDQLGDMALQLLDKFHARQLQARLYFVVYCFIKHWHAPVQSTLAPSKTAYQVGLETGTLEFAAYAGVVCCYHGFMVGQELTALSKEMEVFSEGISHMNQDISWNYVQIVRQTVMNLQGAGKDPTVLVGDACDEHPLLAVMEEANDRTGIFFLLLNKLILQYLFHAHEAAYQLSVKLASYLDGTTALLVVGIYHYFDSLVRLSVYPSASSKEQAVILKKVRANQQKLKTWSRFSPVNYAQKYQLVEAERARVSDHPDKALTYYDEAIRLSSNHHYMNDEALALERAANYCQDVGRMRLSRYYLQDAQTVYAQWGAIRKAEQLASSPQAKKQILSDFGARTTHTGTRHHTALDINAVLKASQTISREFFLDRLIEKLLNIVLQNAGATRADLWLCEDDHWTLEAITNGDETLKPKHSMNDLEAEKYPCEVIQYVIRTRQTFVLVDKTSHPFTDSAYCRNGNCQSMMCLPIIHQNQITVILYLENTLITDAFSVDRLAVLEMLSTQIAISIKNALFYEQQQKTLKAEQARQIAEAANKSKSEFLAHMNHELRSPLNAILGFAQMMQRSDTLPEEHREHVNTIYRSGHYLLSLINDVLDMVKIEAGKITLDKQDFDLHQLLQDVSDLFSLQAQEKGIDFFVDYPDVPRYIHTDGTKLKQVLINLSSNAIKFTHQGGVQVSASIEKSEKNLIIHFVVQDSGAGISDHELDKIFQSFVQTETGRASQQGTGLGLPISRKFVQLMGGDIHVKSEVGKGSTFQFSLPVTFGAGEQNQDKPKQSQPVKPQTSQTPLNYESLQDLSPELLSTLYEAILDADRPVIEACIADIREYDDKLAEALLKLVRSYEYDQLQNLIERAQGEV